MSALGWIGELVAWIVNWLPRLVHVRAGYQAIRYVRSRAEVLEPGLHIYWPITTQVQAYPVARQVLDLPTQTVMVYCDYEECAIPVVVGGVVTYSIADLHAFLVENYDADESLGELARSGVRKSVTDSTVQQINEGRVKVDKSLRRAVQKAVEGLGVEIESAKLTTFAPTQALSLFGNTPSAIEPDEE